MLHIIWKRLNQVCYIIYEKAKSGMLYNIWKRLNQVGFIIYEKANSGLLYSVWKGLISYVVQNLKRLSSMWYKI
jgi:hypothetical protein